MLNVKRFYKWTEPHLQIITIAIGSTIIASWTLLRFWSVRSIFDLVGQQVLTSSFISDGSLDASVGATHYMLKMIFVYAPFELLKIDPRASLIVMTLLLNITAYVGIFFAIKSILKSFHILRPKVFYLAMVWFAAVAGSVFWIEFANSRNIEVAAGLWTIAIGLQFLKTPNIKLSVIWALIAAITFFMDPLQVYMTGLPLLVYIIVVELLPRPKRPGLRRALLAALVLVGSYIIARVMLIITMKVTGIAVISDSSSVLGISSVFGQIADATKGLIAANIRLVAGVVADGGRLRQAVELMSVVGAISVWVLYAIRRKFSPKFVIFIACFTLIIQAVYLLSGQSIGGDTSRYLIMFAPILAIVIASLPPTKLTRVALSAVAITIVTTVIFLGVSLIHAWPNRFQQDQSLAEAAAFVGNNKGVRFYASMDTALPTMYYYPSVMILPLGCSAQGLERSHTFFPGGAFDKHQNGRSELAAIILDKGGSISNDPNVCPKSEIVKRFGEPKEVRVLSNGQEALFYDAQAILF